VNVASTELAPTPSTVPGRTVPAGGSLPAGSGVNGLSAFLSLVTGFLEKKAATRPGQIDPLHSSPSETSRAAGAGKDKTKDSSSDSNKDSKNHSKEEQAVLGQSAHPLQESAAYLTKPLLALEFATPGPGQAAGSEQATSDQNRNDGGSMQQRGIATNPLASSFSALTRSAVDVAFALRLTSNDSETKSLGPPGGRYGVDAPQDQSPSFPISRPLPSPKNALTSEPRIIVRGGPADQVAQKESKTEPVAKPEFPGFHLNEKHIEGNASTLEAPARPPNAAGAPDTRIGRPPLNESPALRVVSEPETKMGIAPPPTRQISLKLSTDDTTRVIVDLTERAGKVLVAVRTTDHEIAQSLQMDLCDLVGRLESRGFKTETWVPATAHPVTLSSQPSNSNTRFDQPQHSGSGNGGGQQQQSQNGSNQRQHARWTAEMKQTSQQMA
jgi:hypothetical protein